MHVRSHLAEARIALRRAQDEYDLVTADAEQRMTDAAGGPKGLGANAEDRARVLRLALMDDDAYQQALATLRAAQADVDRFAAEVEIAIDERKAADRDSRDRLTTIAAPHPDVFAATRSSSLGDCLVDANSTASCEPCRCSRSVPWRRWRLAVIRSDHDVVRHIYPRARGYAAARDGAVAGWRWQGPRCTSRVRGRRRWPNCT